MYGQIIEQEVTNLEFIYQYQPYSSTTENFGTKEDDTNNPFLFLIDKTPIFRKTLGNKIPFLFFDNSSVFSKQKLNSVTETFFTEEIIISDDIIEHDIVVRLNPRKQYAIPVRIKCIKKGTPKIFDSDISNLVFENE